MENSLELGHKALQLWNSEAMSSAPMGLKIWLAILGVTLLSSLFFIKSSNPSRILLIGFISSLSVTKWLAPAVGIETLSGFVGLCHLLFWSPGWVLLIREKLKPNNESKRKVYLAWSWIAITVISISYFFDLRDGFTYLSFILSKV